MRKTIEALAREAARLNSRDWYDVSAAIASTGVPTCLEGEAAVKAKLKDVESELGEKRDELAGLAAARDEARTAWSSTEGPLSQDSPEFEAAQAAVAAHGECADRIAELQAIQVGALKMLGKDPEAQARAGREERAAGDPSDPRHGWDSGRLFEDESVRKELAKIAHSPKMRFGGMDLGSIASRDAMVADITGTTAMRRGDFAGIIPQLRRQLSILDLLPTGTMSENTLPYTQESGSFDTAAETGEGTLKPEGALVLTDQEAIAATIAHWMKVRKQALADSEALRSIMDARLRYGVLRRLEAQVVNGSGSGVNMRGILNTSGIGAVTFTSGALITDQVLRGITTVLLGNARPTGIILNPIDWQTALLAKATGDGHYFSGGPFQVTPEMLWGVPLVPSPVIAAGTCLVGDFDIGAQLLIREGVNVLLSDSDQDDFVNNRVTMLAEMRAALPVFQPTAFCTVATA